MHQLPTLDWTNFSISFVDICSKRKDTLTFAQRKKDTLTFAQREKTRWHSLKEKRHIDICSKRKKKNITLKREVYQFGQSFQSSNLRLNFFCGGGSCFSFPSFQIIEIICVELFLSSSFLSFLLLPARLWDHLCQCLCPSSPCWALIWLGLKFEVICCCWKNGFSFSLPSGPWDNWVWS